MIRKLNSKFQDFLRKKKVEIARFFWDKKKEKVEVSKDNLLEKNGIKSILMIRDDGKIGDMVVSSFFYREIKKQFPDIKIGVVTRGAAKAIIENNHYVDKIYEYKKNSSYLKKLASDISKERYDLLIDTSLFLRERQIMFINKCNCKINLGVEKEKWELFDISVEDNPKEHITKRYVNILKRLGIREINSDYDIQILSSTEERVKNRILELEKIENIKKNKRVVINPYAASKHRSLSKENVIKIGRILLEKNIGAIYILGLDENKKEIEEIKRELGEKRIYHLKTNGIDEVIALIKYSDLVISPDTSIVHIAIGLGKDLIAIYREDIDDNNSIVWGTNSDKAVQIFSRRDNNKDDINNFDINEIEKIIKVRV